MEDVTLNFDRLAELLLQPYRIIELAPGELTADGRTMILIPARSGVPMGLEHIAPESLPRLDLLQSGINLGRRPETIRIEIAQQLKDRRFSVEPDAGFIVQLAFAPLVAVAVLAQVERPLLRPYNFDPEKALGAFIADLPQSEFRICVEGAPIIGLNISQPVRAYTMAAISFLTRLQDFPNESPIKRALHATYRYHYDSYALTRQRKDLQEYTARHCNKWWFELWGGQKRRERSVADHQADLAASIQKAREALAALPA